jgi:hypothetical protein
LNSLALESEFVSEKLNAWINLIFGVHQNSFQHFNVFHPFSYSECLSNPLISNDATTLEFAKQHALSFGSTPGKLFEREHPIRLTQSIRTTINPFSIYKSLNLIHLDYNLALLKDGRVATGELTNLFFQIIDMISVELFLQKKIQFSFLFLNLINHVFINIIYQIKLYFQLLKKFLLQIQQLIALPLLMIIISLLENQIQLFMFIVEIFFKKEKFKRNQLPFILIRLLVLMVILQLI